MKETLATINKEKYLKLGKYVFSPVMELCSGIALKYSDHIYSDDCKKSPLVLCFPQKKGAALWMSIITLANAFLEDYVENVVDGIDCTVGDKVLVYGAVCEIKYISENHITLRFKDQTCTIQNSKNFPISRLLPRISKVSSSRVLNKRSKYNAGKQKYKENRNAISKILLPKDPEIINPHNLNSKVLLIAGRGNVKSFQDMLLETKVYDEELDQIFGSGKNLLIKPDLKHYKGFFKKEDKIEFEEFRESLKTLMDMNIDSEVNSLVSSFLEKIKDVNYISESFEVDFLSFVDRFGDEIPQINFLASKFPGAKEPLPEKLKAVIINDVGQLNDFPETISGFLNSNIPVIVTSNRKVSNLSEINFYEDFFKTNPTCYRFNLNRKKIRELEEFDHFHDYLDGELWHQSKRFAHQKVTINIAKSCELDDLTGLLLNKIREMDEYEILQKSFYNYFYPALYLLKNSNKKNSETAELISNFEEVFDNTIGSGMSKETIDLFENAMQIANSFENNTKEYEVSDNIFCNKFVSLSGSTIPIPNDVYVEYLPSASKSSIVFTGYPYHEYTGKYLLNSVCVDFIPEIKILCWPHEASLTYNYLRRRMISAYFTDNLKGIVDFSDQHLLSKHSQFVEEVDSYLTIDQNIEKKDEQEPNLKYLHTFKYKGYSDSGESNYKVMCNVINFKDNTFMFLPKNSKILSETESIRNTVKINNLRFTELTCGLRIFKHLKDRSLYKEIALKNQEIYEAYNILEVWREKLDVISDKYAGNISDINQHLIRLKKELNFTHAQPTKINIKNWLHDEDMIMPDQENVKLLFASDKNTDLESNFIDKMVNAYRKVLSHRIHLSHMIKKEISNQVITSSDLIQGQFEITVSGVSVKIEVKTIDSLDSSEYEIEYQNTRQILC